MTPLVITATVKTPKISARKLIMEIVTTALLFDAWSFGPISSCTALISSFTFSMSAEILEPRRARICSVTLFLL